MTAETFTALRAGAPPRKITRSSEARWRDRDDIDVGRDLYVMPDTTFLDDVEHLLGRGRVSFQMRG